MSHFIDYSFLSFRRLMITKGTSNSILNSFITSANIFFNDFTKVYTIKISVTTVFKRRNTAQLEIKYDSKRRKNCMFTQIYNIEHKLCVKMKYSPKCTFNGLNFAISEDKYFITLPSCIEFGVLSAIFLDMFFLHNFIIVLGV